MSKQVYEETQEFLSERWGPLGGWAQAVMFAADLKPVTTPTKKTNNFVATPTISPSIKSESSIKVEWSESAALDVVNDEASPLKRKAEVKEFKRTRSATRLSLHRTASDLIADEVAEKLSVVSKRDDSAEMK
jgi:N-glycosylase/DNA lyase